MEDNKNINYENIELRSEKVRNIIGKVPPQLTTGGTVFITLLLFFLFLAAAIIPYPETISSEMFIRSQDRSRIYAEAYVPYRYVTRIHKGMYVNVEMEGYPAQVFGLNNGTVHFTNDSVINQNGNRYFRAYLSLSIPYSYSIKVGMQGTATITITDKTVLKYILRK